MASSCTIESDRLTNRLVCEEYRWLCGDSVGKDDLLGLSYKLKKTGIVPRHVRPTKSFLSDFLLRKFQVFCNHQEFLEIKGLIV